MAVWLHVISAKGAVVTWPAWGSAPGVHVTPEAQALKALFTSCFVIAGLNRAFSAGYEILPVSWGNAPGRHECAPLALNI